MATYYWVGGSGTWDSSTTTNWSLTSGGAGGAGVPGTADNVIFDSNSTTGTVTVDSTAVCNNFTCNITTGSTFLTFQGVLPSGTTTLSVYGSWSQLCNATYSPNWSGIQVQLYGTGSQTLTNRTANTGAVSAEQINFQMMNSGTYTLGSATIIGSMSATSGTFNTNNLNLTTTDSIAGLVFAGSAQLLIGTSAVNVRGTTQAFTLQTGASFTAGTGSIVSFISTNAVIDVSGVSSVSFSDVSFGAGEHVIRTGTSITVRNLSVTPPSPGVTKITTYGQLVVTGTFPSGLTRGRRVFFNGGSISTNSRNLNISNVDFKNVTLFSGSLSDTNNRLGNCGGNTGNFTFPAARVLYAVYPGSPVPWSDVFTNWLSTTSGGSATISSPLPQDTIIFDGNSGPAGATYYIDGSYNIGPVDASARTSTLNLIAGGAGGTAVNPTVHGNWIGGSGLTVGQIGGSGSTLTFQSNKSGLQTITSNGRPFELPVRLYATTSQTADTGVRLLDAFTCLSSLSLASSVTRGYIDFNNFSVTASSLSAASTPETQGTNIELLNVPLGGITVTGTGVAFDNSDNRIISLTGTPLINYTYNGSSPMSIYTGSFETVYVPFTHKNSAGTYTLTIAANSNGTSSPEVVGLDHTSFNGTLTNTTIYFGSTGDVILGTGTSYPSGSSPWYFQGITIITSNGKTLDWPVILSSGTLALNDNLTIGSTRTLTSNSSIINLGSATLSTGRLATNGNTTVDFGTTGKIRLTADTTTLATGAISTVLTAGSDCVVEVVSTGSSGTVTISGLHQAIKLVVLGGTNTLLFGTTSLREFDLSGFTGTVSGGTLTLSPPAGVGIVFPSTVTAFNTALALNNSGGTRSITSGGRTFGGAVTLQGAGTWQLADAFACSSTVTLTQGTLALNNYNLTTAAFSSSNSNTRAIAFGTSGTITLTGSGTIWNTATATSMTITGTPTVNVAHSGTATITAGSPTETNTVSFNINTGSSTITVGGSVRDLNFTGFSGSVTNAAATIYGNLTLGSTASFSTGALAWTFAATTSRTITSNGNSLSCPIVFNGTGGFWVLQDAFTTTDTRTTTLTNGTLNLNGMTYTTGLFTTNSGTKAIQWNGGTMVITGSGTTAWNNANPTNFNNYSVQPSPGAAAVEGMISMTAAGTKTFVGGGATYYAKLRHAGVGALTITGANTFTDMDQTNTTATTIVFPGSTTTVFTKNFSVSGTAGNLVTLSSSSGQVYTLSCYGMPDVSYLSLSNITVTGPLNPRWIQRNSTIGASVTGFNTTAPRTLYWVGGTNTWNATAGTKWALTSGGTGGQAVPTIYDDVIFDSGTNGTGTVTISTNTALCNNVTVASGWTGMIAGSTAWNIYGSMTLSSTMGMTYTGAITFAGGGNSRTINMAGELHGGNITFAGIGGMWDLQDALRATGTLGVTAGWLNNTGSYSINVGSISSASTTYERRITLTNSTVALSGTTPLALAPGNLTLDIDLSTILLSGNVVSFSPGVSTLYNVRFINGTPNIRSIASTLTQVNDLYAQPPATAGMTTITFNGNMTINGALGTLSTAGNRRILFASAYTGLQINLTCNSAPSLTDADFRDIIVRGTAAPISGTRIGNCGGCSGITFTPAKTVYFRASGTANWSADASWALTSGGTATTDAFPLPQDTAEINNTFPSASSSITLDSAVPFVGTMDMTSRTSVVNIIGSTGYNVYGSWKCGPGTNQTYSGTLTFLCRDDQVITSAGKTLPGGITIQSYGGSVTLTDAFNNTGGTLSILDGTFDTAGYAVTTSILSSSSTSPRTINLSSSTINISGVTASSITSTNLTFNAGTSQINFTYNGSSGMTISWGNLTFYNVAFTGSTLAGSSRSISGSNNVFNNLILIRPGVLGTHTYTFPSSTTVNGTFRVVGGIPSRRVLVTSASTGTPATISANSLNVADTDFRDIVITGNAASSSVQTRLGDLGGNSPSTIFPASKTVYFVGNSGAGWGADVWSDTSGGAAILSYFPLAQDTVIIDNATLAAGATINYEGSLPIGTLDASSRTLSATLAAGSLPIPVYGDLKLSSVMSITGTTMNFVGRKTQTITSAGRTLPHAVTINNINGYVQLADAFTTSSTLTLTSGTLDAVNYNVTSTTFSASGTSTRTLKMGSGTWTLSGTGTVWNMTTLTGLTFYKGSANIVLSNTTTTARTFTGGGLAYNKLTIGGTTGISTTTFTSSDTFAELASTKTVAHTIDIGATNPTYGKWSVTGTSGNFVTVTGTGSITIAGPGVSGVNYLVMNAPLSATSPGEFWAGANSTGTGANVTRTAAPTPRTLYWVGGTGNWSSTARWSTASGGASGAAVPTSRDTVIFDSASNATAYTATIDATSRCASLTVAGPATGNVTLAGTGRLIPHDSVTIASTGVTRTFTGPIVFSGTGAGKIINIGPSLASAVNIQGVGASWALGAALDTGTSSPINLITGSFDTAGYTLTTLGIQTSSLYNECSLSLGSSTVLISGASGINFTLSSSGSYNVGLTFNAGTSSITMSGGFPSFYHNGVTFYDMTFTDSTNVGIPFNQSPLNLTFNNLTLGLNTSSAGLKQVILSSNVTVNGSLTFVGSTIALRRTFLQSDTLGLQRTITANSVTGLSDVDFRDINFAVPGGPVTGTRLGDCGGNSGVTCDAPKTVYRIGSNTSWEGSNSWALTSGGAGSNDNFPLPQDTAIIDNVATAGTINHTVFYNISALDCSSRTNSIGLAFNSSLTRYGSFILGPGVSTVSGTNTQTFSGRGTSTISCYGRALTFPTTINALGGTIQLGDALNLGGQPLWVLSGTFNAATYNVTIGSFNSTTDVSARTVLMGDGLWTLTGVGIVWNIGSAGPNLTFNKGNANILLSDTSTTTKSFGGGGYTYNKLTIGGATGTTATDISGNNTFSEIASIKTVPYTLTLSSTTQRVGAFTAAGTAGNLLTITGTGLNSPATLIYTGAEKVNVNNTSVSFIRGYPLSSTWYMGTNSTITGTLGMLRESLPVTTVGSRFFMFF